MKAPSFERGCSGKSNLGWSSFIKNADHFSKKHGKQYGVYRCPHCKGTHLTTKLTNRGMYPPLLYITNS